MQKENNRNNNRTLIILNSITNADKFTSRYENFKGKIFLCLDGDKAGNYTTEKILNDLKDQNIKDIRPFYNISENANNDLNDYLKQKLNIQNNNSNLATNNSLNNEHTTIRPGKISNIKHMGDETPGRDSEDSARKANPSKTEITQKDLLWAATMLEMDLQAQSGAIPQYPEDEENLRLEHNKKMLQKMKQQNIPWAESYPGELYPIEDQEI